MPYTIVIYSIVIYKSKKLFAPNFPWSTRSNFGARPWQPGRSQFSFEDHETGEELGLGWANWVDLGASQKSWQNPFVKRCFMVILYIYTCLPSMRVLPHCPAPVKKHVLVGNGYYLRLLNGGGFQKIHWTHHL